MNHFYSWLLSRCCDAKIHNGLCNEDKRHECSGCGEIVDMDKGTYDTKPEYRGVCGYENPVKFSLSEICDIWHSLYGEKMEQYYPGFVDEIKQREA